MLASAIACRGTSSQPDGVDESSSQPPTAPAPGGGPAKTASRSPSTTGADRGNELPPFNRRVLELIEGYRELPPGGYEWPALAGTHGTTTDLYFGDTRIARKGRGSHCVGVTFEVFWRALKDTTGGGRGIGLDLATVNEFRSIWYVPGNNKGRGAVQALEETGLGFAITNLENAMPGDFVQAWMNDGNGHSMVFSSWMRDSEGRRIGIRYWSSQPWTQGLGHSHGGIGHEPGQFAPDAIYVGRASPQPLRGTSDSATPAVR